ncbi:ABC transporter permease [Solirubrobacter sp. CPCC 204708]|uniref:Transport permease protein n=1 Tax=Solirubrobacter deserti TaxID=2282478 RepID=A0ABT4RNE4_9ACTN|nr:ABC transporter permease [Solirubrobacter deserti]MBE2317418.1 ABC transporter permease [Solirubrobacter deserti]MDA0140000.1 ABC transporter permease [Solirubrobacter deserti]
MSVSTPHVVQRPSVIGSDFKRFFALAWTLAVTDWKLRFYGSALGYAWTLARPFLFFGVIYFVFTEIVGLNKDVPNYGIVILFSLVLFNFFGEATGGCVSCLVVRESLLRKVRFPRLVIPTSVILVALFNLGMTLIAVVIFGAFSGVYPKWSWFELIPIIVAFTMFAAGVGLLLSALFVRFRDVEPIWDVFTQMLFYASPLLYVASNVPEKYLDLYMLNPIATLLTATRHVAVDPNAPEPWDLVSSPELLLIPAALVVGLLVLGAWVFSREAPKIAENL